MDDDEFISIETRQSSQCPWGQKSCCDPVGNDIFRGSEFLPSDQDVCSRSDVVAVQDFSHGATCGKRDSLVYYDAGLPRSFTNPGEWPWAVMIWEGEEYVGAGALVSNDVVVTAAHKVRKYQGVGYRLTVRLGDWNPLARDSKEDFPEIVMTVECLTLHPDADLDNTLANNVAVLKLERLADQEDDDERKTVASVVGPRSSVERRGDQPSYQDKRDGASIIDVRLGLVADSLGVDPLGNIDGFTSSYINHICLPRRKDQFEGHKERCWVASWGTNQDRQREVELPILSR